MLKSVRTNHMSSQSIPAATVQYSMSDIVRTRDSSKNYRGQLRVRRVGFRSRTAPLPNPLPEEFLQRFASPALRTPRIFGFDHLDIQQFNDQPKRGVNGFFPPIKLRSIDRAQTSHEMETNEDIALGPIANQTLQHKNMFATRYPVLDRERTMPADIPAIYQHVNYTHKSPDGPKLDDLSYLPKPLRVAPKKDLPWVYRYKVKQSMNKLSKIMASKPLQSELTVAY